MSDRQLSHSNLLALLAALAAVALAAVPGVALAGDLPVPLADQLARHSEAAQPEVRALQHPVAASPIGAAQFSFPIAPAPALAAPGLSLDYDSFSRGSDAEMPRGWSIGGIPHIAKDPRSPEDFWLGGGAISGYLSVLNDTTWPVEYSIRTHVSGDVSIHYHLGDDRWTIDLASGGHWVLDATPDTNSSHWRATEYWDANDNGVLFVYDGARLERVLYGGRRTTLYPAHDLCIDFSYQERPHVRGAGGFGGYSDHDRVLRQVRVGRLFNSGMPDLDDVAIAPLPDDSSPSPWDDLEIAALDPGLWSFWAGCDSEDDWSCPGPSRDGIDPWLLKDTLDGAEELIPEPAYATSADLATLHGAVDVSGLDVEQLSNLRVVLLDREPLLKSDLPPVPVGTTVEIDLHGALEAGMATFTLEEIPPREEPYHLLAFLEDFEPSDPDLTKVRLLAIEDKGLPEVHVPWADVYELGAIDLVGRAADKDVESSVVADAGPARVLEGTLTASASAAAGGDKAGFVYLALFEQDPRLSEDPKPAVVSKMLVDLSAPGAEVAYKLDKLPEGTTSWFIVAFLDDDDSAIDDGLRPGLGDLVALQGEGELPQIMLTGAGPTWHDIDLSHTVDEPDAYASSEEGDPDDEDFEPDPPEDPPYDPPADDDDDWTFEPAPDPYGPGDCVPFRDYELEVEFDGPVALLTRIQEIGWENAMWRGPGAPAVEFEYAAYEPDMDESRHDGTSIYPFTDLGRAEDYSVLVGGAHDDDQGVEVIGLPDGEGFLWSYLELTIGAAKVASLQDFDGDGLLDYLETDGDGGWTLHRQTIDGGSAHHWDGPGETFDIDDAPWHLGETRTFYYVEPDLSPLPEDFDVDENQYLYTFAPDGTALQVEAWQGWGGEPDNLPPGSSAAYAEFMDISVYQTLGLAVPSISAAVSQLVDLNGDGYPDFVWNEVEAPDTAFLPRVPAGYDSPSLGGSSLFVRYGSMFGFDSQTTIEPSPFNSLHVDYITGHQTISGDTWPTPSSRHGIVRLQDINSDGWSDILHTEPGGDGSIEVYLHAGEEGLGWAFSYSFEPPWIADLAAHYPGSTARRAAMHHYLSSVETVGWSWPSWHFDDDITAEGREFFDALGAGPLGEIGSYMDFADLNGDGLSDMVLAQPLAGYASPASLSEGDWLVYFGNGSAFEDGVVWSGASPRLGVSYSEHGWEGSPDGNEGYCGFSLAVDDPYGAGILEADIGNEAGAEALSVEVKRRLKDVDQDGLPDLIVGNSDLTSYQAPDEGWYRNLGDGFATTSEPLPDWWNPAPNLWWTDVAHRIGNTMASCGGVNADTSDGQVAGIEVNVNASYDYALVADLDGDGIADALDLGMNRAPDEEVHFGSFPRPHVMTRSEVERDLRTDISYRPASAVYPSGVSWEVKQVPFAFDLVDHQQTRDLRTGMTGDTSYEYEHGRWSDGRLLGFEFRSVSSSEAVLGTNRMLEIEEAYELEYELPPLMFYRSVHTPIGYLPEHMGELVALPVGQSANPLRQEAWWQFEDYDLGDHDRRLLYEMSVFDYPEHGSETDFRRTEVTFGRLFSTGDVTSIAHDGGGDPSRAFTADYEYARNGPLTRISRATIEQDSGPDGVPVLLQDIRQYYDGSLALGDLLGPGNVTRVEQLAGEEDDPEGDVLAWEIQRGFRGQPQITTDLTWGTTTSQTWTFGEALLETSSDGLRSRHHDYDQRGRLLQTTDLVSGTSSEWRYDGLDRLVREYTTDTAGSRFLLRSQEYGEAPFGRTTTTLTYDYGGLIDTESMLVADGLGRPFVSLGESDDGDIFVGATIHDLRGNLVQTRHPVSLSAVAPFPPWFLNYMPVAEQSYLNGLGELRRHTRDVSAGLPSANTSNPDPGVVTTVDEEGFTRRIETDALGNVSSVHQGGVLTASYQHDGAGQLREYVDGNGNQYLFDYDLAGRLRGASGPDIGWREYEYQGALRTHAADSAGLTVDWIYDPHARLDTLLVDDPLAAVTALDPLDDGRASYGWTWHPLWPDQPQTTTDPQGTTSFDYDAFGRVDWSQRTWTDSADAPVLTWAQDLQGRVTFKELGGGSTQQTTWEHGWATGMEIVDPSGSAAQVDLDFDFEGRLTDWTSSLGHTYHADYTFGQQPDLLQLSFGGDSWVQDYGWLDNGLLDSAHRSSTSVGALPAALQQYDYDPLLRLTAVDRSYDDPANGAPSAETFAFDAVGNLLEHAAPGAPLRTPTLTAGNLRDGVTDDSSTVEVWEHDSAGRVTSIDDDGGMVTYDYDGLGRLRRASQPDGSSVTLHRDASGDVIRREHDDGADVASEWVFGAWRRDERSGSTREAFDLGWLDGGERRWALRGVGGQAEVVLDDSGLLVVQRDYRAYGLPWAEQGDGPQDDSLHGLPFDDASGLYFAGRRAFLAEDGQWLQPEPLLLEGLVGLDLGDPQTWSPYRYGRNTPDVMVDASGEAPEWWTTGWREFRYRMTGRHKGDKRPGAFFGSHRAAEQLMEEDFGGQYNQHIVDGYDDWGTDATAGVAMSLAGPEDLLGPVATAVGGVALVIKLRRGARAARTLAEIPAAGRVLRLDDLGLKGTVKELSGRISKSDDTLLVRIDMIEGEIDNPLQILQNLAEGADGVGATHVRIEGLIANERLDAVLRARYGLETIDGVDVIEFAIDVVD